MKGIDLHTQTGLGYDFVKERLRNFADTESGKERCFLIEPYEKFQNAVSELERVGECSFLLQTDEPFYFTYSGSVQHHLEQVSIKGNWLKEKDLFSILKWLKMLKTVNGYFKTRREQAPELWKLTSGILPDPGLVKDIDRIFDDTGMLRDNASDALRSIRKSKADAETDLRRLLSSVLRNAVSQGWSEAGELTIRNGRMVIPLKTDFKGKIKGFVQDISSSGQTIFLEPSASLELNNRISELRIAETAEIRKILIEAADRIREHLPELKKFEEAVTRLDVIRAKARFGNEIGAVKPHFKKNSEEYRLVQGKHPMLLWMKKKGELKGNVVPLSFSLIPNERIILISGPNAGGKSVALKTAGLLQLMIQTGMTVPVDENSEFRWFDSVITDIGDDQSIQNDLSTYTSHLTKMKFLLDHLNGDVLFLLDEFGSGTDPRMGGALAEAFLEEFLASGAYGIVATHYGNLKKFADAREGIINGAMQFDPESLRPTYHLQIGIPGRSYAFEIASNVGIPARIIEDAKDKTGEEGAYTEELLLKLEQQNDELEKLIEDNHKKNEELRHLMLRNQEVQRKMKQKEQEIIEHAHLTAKNLIKEANARIENTIREIRESQAEKEHTKTLRKELAQMLPEMPEFEKEEEVEIQEQMEPVYGEPVSEGDFVLWSDSEREGQVIEIKGNRAVISIGDLRVTAKLKELQKLKKSGKKIDLKKRQAIVSEKKMAFNSILDVKGLRVENALGLLEKFIDDALLAAAPQISILHGKGSGALRSAIREYLLKLPQVEAVADAEAAAGGSGWTICQFKGN